MARTGFAGLTDTGLLRQQNEDRYLVLSKHRLIAVADGMGGHRSGDVASQLAVTTLSDFFTLTIDSDATWPFPADPSLTEEGNYMVTALRLANRRIYEQSLKNAADFGMGTTVVSAMFSRNNERVTVAHVGDSRCYRIRGNHVQQLTRDHSLLSDASTMAPWLSPEELKQLPPNIITRALGIRDDVLIDVLTEETQPGDTYLLCSDGLSGLVSDDEIYRIVASYEVLDEACKSLVSLANQLGGTDNITVVLGRVE